MNTLRQAVARRPVTAFVVVAFALGWHASFNASGSLGFAGGWQFLPALLLLSMGLAVVRRVRRTQPTSIAPSYRTEVTA